MGDVDIFRRRSAFDFCALLLGDDEAPTAKIHPSVLRRCDWDREHVSDHPLSA